MKVTLWNRAVDQPYKVVGTWYVDQWRKIGVNANHRVLETGPYFTALRSGDYEASVDFSCDFADEPGRPSVNFGMRRAAEPTLVRQLRAMEQGAVVEVG